MFWWKLHLNPPSLLSSNPATSQIFKPCHISENLPNDEPFPQKCWWPFPQGVYTAPRKQISAFFHFSSCFFFFFFSEGLENHPGGFYQLNQYFFWFGLISSDLDHFIGWETYQGVETFHYDRLSDERASVNSSIYPTHLALWTLGLQILVNFKFNINTRKSFLVASLYLVLFYVHKYFVCFYLNAPCPCSACRDG